MIAKMLIVGLLSAGWLFPAYLTYAWFLSSLNPGNSFPFAEWSRHAFGVTCIWLAMVIVAWCAFAARRLGTRRDVQ